MAPPQRKMHSLEGIVAVCALILVLFVSIGFAQASDLKKIKLRSESVLVQDAETGEIVYDKNSDAVVPIASITKLMTAMVLLDKVKSAGLDMEQRVVLTRDDIDRVKGTRSRLRTGASLTRDELLLLALMASENKAAHALGRTYPGGMDAFVAAMNKKAAQLGMADSRFVDPTGLSSENVSSARDLAKLVEAASGYEKVREYSVRPRAKVRVGKRVLTYGNTNALVRNDRWDIDLSKTGYISEAGRCLVMRVRMASKDMIVVLLDSWGKYSRIGDANRLRKWLESTAPVGHPG
ncbi:MAG TPA: D-alanyl-D-alanine endopeptidase [Burkholderiales bacterium]|nr:D-alanyl-D-alanine endopeptidase [Burkholderiales bacterium]